MADPGRGPRRLTGTVRAGVEHGVLVLDDAAGRTWQLVGAPVRGVRPGTSVEVTGRPDDAGTAGTGQQGHRFRVETVTARPRTTGDG